MPAITRHQAVVLRDVMLTLASGGMISSRPLTGVERQAIKRIYKTVDKAISRRDRAQKRKDTLASYGIHGDPPQVSEDQPFEELKGIV